MKTFINGSEVHYVGLPPNGVDYTWHGGLCSRKDGPAIIRPTGVKEFIFNGKFIASSFIREGKFVSTILTDKGLTQAGKISFNEALKKAGIQYDES